MPLLPTHGLLGTYFKVAPKGTDRKLGPICEFVLFHSSGCGMVQT